MAGLEITPDLVGRKVCNPARPDWGLGTVLRVQSTAAGEQQVHRVSVQFATGHRVIVIPPGHLAEPTAGPQREAGWLDRVAQTTIDDRLAALPAAVREFLGTSAQRLVVLARLFEIGADPGDLLKWARSQTGVADPLSLWTRDEIRAAFDEFCRRRDTLLRETLAALRRASGQTAIQEALNEVPETARQRMLELIR
ncbi:MAG: DUF3553 domain-containing protein [Planctomycetota bacterium]